MTGWLCCFAKTHCWECVRSLVLTCLLWTWASEPRRQQRGPLYPIPQSVKRPRIRPPACQNHVAYGHRFVVRQHCKAESVQQTGWAGGAAFVVLFTITPWQKTVINKANCVFLNPFYDIRLSVRPHTGLPACPTSCFKFKYSGSRSWKFCVNCVPTPEVKLSNLLLFFLLHCWLFLNFYL